MDDEILNRITFCEYKQRNGDTYTKIYSTKDGAKNVKSGRFI